MAAASQSGQRVQRVRLPWEKWPAGVLLFATVSILMLVFALSLDRTYMVDQVNYLKNFSEAPTLDWLKTLLEGGTVLRDAMIALLSEELLWHLWATFWGSLLEPGMAVLMLVGVLNLLVVLSARYLPNPTLGVFLWIAIPVGFADIGLVQLRQGFAFGIALFVAIRYRRAVLAMLLAAMIHTTFAVAFVFAVIARIFRQRPLVALAVSTLIAFAGAYAGRVLFDAFGGRRLLIYSVSEGATSLNYVFGGLVAIVPSVYWLMTSPRSGAESERESVISALAVVHAGCTVFTIFAFFLFPIGTGRIGYVSQLFLIPILPALSLRPNRAVNLGIFSFMLVYVVYLIGSGYSTGAYGVF